MVLYLIQHGEAKSESEDPERKLTKRGIKEVKKISKYLHKIKPEIKNIYCSKKKRAIQTAEILAKRLKLKRDVIIESEGLSPNDDPSIWIDKLNNLNKNTIIVGHLPHLQRLSSYLLSKNFENKIIKFRYSAIICLEKIDEEWSIKWMITPELI